MATMTKTQVLDENKRLRDQCEVLERKLREAKEEITRLSADYAFAAETALGTERYAAAQQQPAAQAPAARVPHATYYDYVRACKALARHRGQRVATYAPRAEWEKRVAAYRASVQ